MGEFLVEETSSCSNVHSGGSTHTRPLISDMVKTINFLAKMQHTTETFFRGQRMQFTKEI